MANYILEKCNKHLANLMAFSNEFQRARKKFPEFHSTHEGYAIIKEELDEMWDAIKRNDAAAARVEAVQVGAMVLAFLTETY